MQHHYDLLVIGGGINGTAVARDAAGRGLSVLLCEQDDLANHTSSASTKLIHGGLRYLEQYEFRLVRESLKEREVLLRAAPHIIWPLRFVLPYDKGLRPAWLLRLGLFIYDHIGGRKTLPATKTVKLGEPPHAGILKEKFKKGFEYSDCWVEDARLVVLNALDAQSKGADIRTRTTVTNLTASQGGYTAQITQTEEKSSIKARAVVNAAGPWVEDVLLKIKPANNDAAVRLIKGSHIVAKKLFEGDHAYIFQNADNRIIFAIPYENNFTLIGTTDLPYSSAEGPAKITDEEISYLCSAASEYFNREISRKDVIWSYSGIRPLYDDKNESVSAVTRDYVLDLEEFTPKAPFLSVYGGKITTSRKLAEHALEKLEPFFTNINPPWTASAVFPGGDILNADFQTFYKQLSELYPAIPRKVLLHLARRYGTRISLILEERNPSLGHIFGEVLSEAEVRYLVEYEWATTADDILWRRTKTGLPMSSGDEQRFRQWFSNQFADGESLRHNRCQ